MGIACILIIFAHSFFLSEKTSLIYFFRTKSQIGVDIFLFLSGIGLYYSYIKNNNIKEFYLKRFSRILPLYFIIIIIWLSFFDKNINTFMDFFNRITFIDFFIDDDFSHWFIIFILLMYLIFPILYKILFVEIEYEKTYLFIITLILTVVIYVALSFVINSDTKEPYWIELFLSRMSIFLWGIVAGYFVKNNFKINFVKTMIYLILTIIVGFSLIYYKVGIFASLTFTRCLYAPMAIALCIILSQLLTLLKDNGFIKQILAYIGKYTLEIYLLYEKVEGLILEEFRKFDNSGILCIAISIIITFVLADFFNYLVNGNLKKIIINLSKYK